MAETVGFVTHDLTGKPHGFALGKVVVGQLVPNSIRLPTPIDQIEEVSAHRAA